MDVMASRIPIFCWGTSEDYWERTSLPSLALIGGLSALIIWAIAYVRLISINIGV